MLRDTPEEIRLSDYRPPDFMIDQVALDFELDRRQTRVQATLMIRRNAAAGDPSAPLRLHGEQLQLLALSLDGQPLSGADFQVDEEGLTIHRVPDRCELYSEVQIDPQSNSALEGLYLSGGIFCTQCEAEGFRRITYFLDRPDVMARFRTTLTAHRADCPVLLSNGNPVVRGELDDGRHFVTWEDPYPKPCYLFALVAGDLQSIEDRHVTPSGREVTLRIYVEQENIDKCDHAMASLRRAMQWDEQQYGREYDLDIYMIVAVSHFNMGAMENKGLNLFNAKYVLASPETATDQDFQGVEGVIAHEYFHNWTGNRITCRDWFQLSLKEGLTVFRDQEFSADMGSREVKRIEDVRLLRAHQFAEDAGPMAHPVRPDRYIEINNFYTVTVYEKGAEVVRMQRRLLGAEAWRRATDLYFERFDGQAVTTDDFVACMEQAGERDLTQFKRWYSQAGTPRLQVNGRYDHDRQQFLLEVEQSCPATPGQPEKAPFHIPFTVGLLDTEGRELPLQLQGEATASNGSRTLELRQVRERFLFTGVPVEPVPSLLRGFSAPVKLAYDYSDDQLMLLIAHDSDGFNRWDAAQTLAQRLLLARIRGEVAPDPGGFIDAFHQALTDRDSDQALLAEILTLPSEGYLGDQLEVVEVDAIHRERRTLQVALAAALRDPLLAVYHENAERDDYDIRPASIARRRLKNLALGYLVKLGEPSLLQLAVDQFHANDSMTDSIAALALLADSDAEAREALLEEFHQRWRHEPLVLDKWFSVQAVSSRDDTLEQVTRLLRHDDFSLHNPNRVRSLLGIFCSGNPVRFHAADGGGYRLLTDQVLALDPLNPQIAARLLRVLARWQRYDDARQAQMRAQLERVIATEGISPDLYEITSRSLRSD